MSENNLPSPRLFIGSLPYRFSEGELLELFIPFGKIVSLKIIKNRWGKSRGMGYLEFDNLDSAITAKEKMHKYKLGDLGIIVDFAKPDPFLTPEGQARHQEALNRHPERLEREKDKFKRSPQKKLTGSDSPRPYKKDFKKGPHLRQSVYDSRTHHARVGAKFSRRNKKNK